MRTRLLPTQNASTVSVRYKRQASKGAAESGSGATALRLSPSQSMGGPDIPIVENDEIRNDEMTARGTHGSRSGGAAYVGNFSPGTWDELVESALRGAYEATFDLDETDMTSITTTTSTIVAAASSWITKLVEAGDMVKLTGHATAGNNGRWLPVLAVSATDITTLAGALTLNATPDTAFTLTVAKRVKMGIAKHYYTVEEYLEDITKSILGTDMVVTKLELSAQPNQHVKVTPTFMGRDVQPIDATTTPTSPVFTSPTATTNDPVTLEQGVIILNGVATCVLTGVSLTIDRGGSPVAVLCETVDDIALAPAKVSGSISAIQQDIAFLKSYVADDVVSLMLVLRQTTDEASDFGALWLGNIQLGKPSAQIAASGPRTETIPFTAHIDLAGSGRPATTVKYASSAA